MSPYNQYGANTTRSTTSSPTPREVRRLASDHDFVFQATSPRPRQLGWWPFIATHLSIPTALCAGAIFTVVAIVYTNSTTKRVLDCPNWATNCPRVDSWTIEHLGTVQGIITLLFSIGLAALAYVALCLCESAFWPLLTRQTLTIKELDAYLSTTRGLILSAPRALMAIKTLATGAILACAIVATLLPLAAAPLVGHAFTPTRVPVQLESNYTAGGGIKQLYAQTEPPTSVIVDVLAEYNAWATNPSSEPLLEHRDWYIDREALRRRGSFAGQAVKLKTSIICRPHKVKQVSRDGLAWNAFETNMTRSTRDFTSSDKEAEDEDDGNSSDVWVRSLPQMAVWADDFVFVSPHRTKSTLVFTALNGTIEGGEWAPVILGEYTGASSIACEVDIEGLNDVLSVVESDSSVLSTKSPNPILSSLDTLTVNPSVPSETAINELLLWFAVAPLLVGSSVDGTQPMFFNSSTTNRAVPYTSSTPARNDWTLPGIQSFIRLSVGALAQATSTSTTTNLLQPANITLPSTSLLLTLSPSRSLILLIPPLLILGLTLVLAVFNVFAHRRDGIPVMRMAGIAEVLKSAQTAYLRERAAEDSAKTYLPAGELDGTEVRFGVDGDGIVGLGGGPGGMEGLHGVVGFMGGGEGDGEGGKGGKGGKGAGGGGGGGGGRASGRRAARFQTL